MTNLTPEQILDHWDRGTLWPGGSGLALPVAYGEAPLSPLRVGFT